MENFDITKKLKSKGYKFTPQRKAIVETVIEHQGEHLSPEEIYDYVKVKNPEIGLATVYRTLQILVDLDFLSVLNLNDGFARYELNVTDKSGHHHHHLICVQCGKIIEVFGDYLVELEDKIEKEYKFKINDHKLKFFGVCEDCDDSNE